MATVAERLQEIRDAFDADGDNWNVSDEWADPSVGSLKDKPTVLARVGGMTAAGSGGRGYPRWLFEVVAIFNAANSKSPGVINRGKTDERRVEDMAAAALGLLRGGDLGLLPNLRPVGIDYGWVPYRGWKASTPFVAAVFQCEVVAGG